MDIPYTWAFVVLLLVYMIYSVWARLDGRYPIGAALALLIVTAVVDTLGQTSAADTLAEFVFFLLGGGVVLLLVEHLRERPVAAPPSAGGSLPAESEPSEATQERKGPAQESLDRFEEKSVPVVDRTRREDRADEPESDPDPDRGQGPVRNVGMQ
jgi:hypothetical protein